MAAMTDFLENRIIDELFRGTPYSIPTSLHIGLLNSLPTDSSAGTEVSGNGYARVSVASSLANWAGTQGAGTTVASTGNTGTTSNNTAIVFPTPTAAWSTTTTPTVAVGVWDAATGGNLLLYAPLAVPKVINQADDIRFAAGQLAFQIDN